MPPLIEFAAASGHLNIEAWILRNSVPLAVPSFPCNCLDVSRGLCAGRCQDAGGSKAGWPRAEPRGDCYAAAAYSGYANSQLCSYGRVGVLCCKRSSWGSGFLYFGIEIYRERTHEKARRLLLASVLYMPLLLIFLVFDSGKFSIFG